MSSESSCHIFLRVRQAHVFPFQEMKLFVDETV